jgi:hypothetical protein
MQKLSRSGELAYHGDLKPENLIVKPSGSIVMIDPALRANEKDVITTTPHYNPWSPSVTICLTTDRCSGTRMRSCLTKGPHSRSFQKTAGTSFGTWLTMVRFR